MLQRPFNLQLSDSTGMQDLAGNALCRLRGWQLLSRRLLSCVILLCVLPAELLRAVPACHCAQVLDNPAATILKLIRSEEWNSRQVSQEEWHGRWSPGGLLEAVGSSRHAVQSMAAALGDFQSRQLCFSRKQLRRGYILPVIGRWGPISTQRHQLRHCCGNSVPHYCISFTSKARHQRLDDCV